MSDTDLKWVLQRVADNLRLSQREISGLEKYLHKNYLRDLPAVETFVNTATECPAVLHPVMFEALRDALNARRDIVEAHEQYDRLTKVVTPHFFRHSPIYVHRIWKPRTDIPKFIVADARGNGDGSQFEFGVITQTVALDVSDQINFSVFRKIVSCQLQIPLSTLHMWTASAPAQADMYAYGTNAPVAERMEWDQTNLPRRMIELKDTEHSLNALRIGPGSEIFCISTAQLDLDVMCIEGVALLWAGESDMFYRMEQIPIPVSINNALNQCQYRQMRSEETSDREYESYGRTLESAQCVSSGPVNDQVQPPRSHSVPPTSGAHRGMMRTPPPYYSRTASANPPTQYRYRHGYQRDPNYPRTDRIAREWNIRMLPDLLGGRYPDRFDFDTTRTYPATPPPIRAPSDNSLRKRGPARYGAIEVDMPPPPLPQDFVMPEPFYLPPLDMEPRYYDDDSDNFGLSTVTLHHRPRPAPQAISWYNEQPLQDPQRFHQFPPSSEFSSPCGRRLRYPSNSSSMRKK